MANEASITLEQLFRFFRGYPHQLASIPMLEEDLRQNGYAVAMRRDRPWFATWSQAGRIPEMKQAIDLLRTFEGLATKAYPDPLSGGAPWTIGFGTTVYPSGKPVKKGDTCTPEDAQRYLINACEDVAHKLAAVIPHWREMNEEMQSSLISFAWNLGQNFYGSPGFETISRALRERRWRDVPGAMMLYRNPGSNVEEGLKRRRKAEGQLWLRGFEILSAELV